MCLSGLRCYVYIDGAFVRERCREAGTSQYVDPRQIARLVTDSYNAADDGLSPPRFYPVRIFYYETMDAGISTDERDGLTRYLTRLRSLPDIRIITGFATGGRSIRRERKGASIQLAVDAMEAAFSGTTDAVALVAGSADYTPLLQAIRRAGPHTLLLAFDHHVSDDLLAAADRYVLLDQAQDWSLR